MAVILDIEMPTSCLDCPCCDKDSGWCQVTGRALFIERPYKCPLVEEKHGQWVEPDHPINQLFKIHLDTECKNCGAYGNSGMNYCYNCGAIMDKEAK